MKVLMSEILKAGEKITIPLYFIGNETDQYVELDIESMHDEWVEKIEALKGVPEDVDKIDGDHCSMNSGGEDYEDESPVPCSVCFKECIKDPDCVGNWLCPDKNCNVHKEE